MYYVFPPLLVGKSILQPWVNFHNYLAYCFLMVSSQACVDKYSKTKKESYTNLQSFVHVWLCLLGTLSHKCQLLCLTKHQSLCPQLSQNSGLSFDSPSILLGPGNSHQVGSKSSLKTHIVCIPSFSTCCSMFDYCFTYFSWFAIYLRWEGVSISSMVAKSASSDYILVSKTNLLCELEPLISLGFSFYLYKIMLTYSAILNVPDIG